MRSIHLLCFSHAYFLLQKKNTQPKGASGCNIQLVQSSLGTRRGQNQIIIFIYSIETKFTCACCVNICVYLSYDCNDIDVMPVETCFWFVLLSGSKSAKVAYKGCYINLVTDAVTSFFFLIYFWKVPVCPESNAATEDIHCSMLFFIN